MLYTWTHGIDNTNGIDLDSWYRIGTPESHTYERAECYPYAGFFLKPSLRRPFRQNKKVLEKVFYTETTVGEGQFEQK